MPSAPRGERLLIKKAAGATSINPFDILKRVTRLRVVWLFVIWIAVLAVGGLHRHSPAPAHLSQPRTASGEHESVVTFLTSQHALTPLFIHRRPLDPLDSFFD